MITGSNLSGLETAADVDVLVVGGGPAGVAAGFAAARMDAKTLIVEQFNCLGGVATAGGHGHICQYSAWCDINTRVVGGVPWEMAERCTEAGYGRHDACNSDFEVEGMKLILDQMAAESGCDLLYHTFFCDTVVENGSVVGAVIQNKSGRQLVRAKRIVDCTGDGDVAAFAGCGFDVGDADDNNRCQPVTLMFTVGGVDWPRVQAFMKEIGGTDGLDAVWKQAQNEGRMRPFQSRLMGWWWTPTRPDHVGVNFTHVIDISALSAGDLTRATIEARKQAFETIEVFRGYIPGMGDCYMISTPNTIGLRESRRVHGGYTLTREDVMGEQIFEDSIGYGSFFIDIHSVSGPGMDKKTWRPPKGFKYQIPFRITVPRDVENLLVAGRCASATHEALGSLRVMPQCGVTGQAAGVASVLSLRDGVAAGDVQVSALQSELRNQNCIVTEEDIIRQ